MEAKVRNRNISVAHRLEFDSLGKKVNRKIRLRETQDIKQEKKVTLDTRRDNVKTGRKLRHPFLGDLCKRVPTSTSKIWRRDPKQTQARITTENEKDNIMVCVYFSFFFNNLFLPIESSWLIFHILFSLSSGTTENILAKNLLHLWTRNVFCVSLNFSHGEVTTGFRLKLKV